MNDHPFITENRAFILASSEQEIYSRFKFEYMGKGEPELVRLGIRIEGKYQSRHIWDRGKQKRIGLKMSGGYKTLHRSVSFDNPKWKELFIARLNEVLLDAEIRKEQDEKAKIQKKLCEQANEARSREVHASIEPVPLVARWQINGDEEKLVINTRKLTADQIGRLVSLVRVMAPIIVVLFVASCEAGRSYPPAAYFPPAPPSTPACMMPERRISTYEYSKLTGSFNNPTLLR